MKSRNRMGLDVSTLGNHEFDYGWQRIRRTSSWRSSPSYPPTLKTTKANSFTGKGYAILTVGTLRVAVIGVLLAD